MIVILQQQPVSSSKSHCDSCMILKTVGNKNWLCLEISNYTKQNLRRAHWFDDSCSTIGRFCSGKRFLYCAWGGRSFSTSHLTATWAFFFVISAYRPHVVSVGDIPAATWHVPRWACVDPGSGPTGTRHRHVSWVIEAEGVLFTNINKTGHSLGKHEDSWPPINAAVGHYPHK